MRYLKMRKWFNVIISVTVLIIAVGYKPANYTDVFAEYDDRIGILELEVGELQYEVEELKNEIDRIDITDRRTVQALGDVVDIIGRDIDDGNLLGTFEATAYSDNVESQGQWVGQTTTGRKPQVGVIAVDPKVIPLESNLFVEGYGYAVAGDTGGAIKGKRVDLFMNTRPECTKFGRQKVRVWKLD